MKSFSLGTTISELNFSLCTDIINDKYYFIFFVMESI